jgi:hypothetical protein
VLLWDVESRSWGAMIEQISPIARRSLALDSIELTLRSFRPSFEGLFDGSTVSFSRDALVLLRRRLNEDSLGVPEDQFFDDLYALQENDYSPGTASIVMAISECADSLRRELTPADVLAVMSASYEALLNSERIPRVTIEAERNNDSCVRLISAQLSLIEVAVSSE